MAKIGRNDPCPCGSGKKYKKCCMRKDEEERLSKISEEEFFEDKIPDGSTYEENNFFDDEYDRNEMNEEKYIEEYQTTENRPRKEINEEVPEIGDEENALVDAWWEKYKKLKSSDEIRQHLEDFFSSYPELVPNLELHNEVLFELGAQYVEEGRPKEYVDLLERVRKDFPDSYIKSFGYYDLDIISFKVITDHKDEIPDYLSYFREYPDQDPHNLFKVINFLMANNCQDIVTAFVREIYYEVCVSPNIIGSYDILRPLILTYFIPFLESDFKDYYIEKLSNQMKEIKIPLKDDYYRLDFLKKMINIIRGSHISWNINDCKNKQEIYTRYNDTTLNFMGYLKEKKNKDWIAAEFYRDLVYVYLVYAIPEGKRPKEAFVFTKKKIEETIYKTCKELFFLDSTRTLGSLNAIYWFAEYLEATEYINQERRIKIQEWCSELFNQIFPDLMKNEISALAFERFPKQ